MNRLTRLAICLLVWFCLLAARPPDAEALEIAGTASFGVFKASGGAPRFAVSPGAVLRLGSTSGFNFSLQDSVSLFPGPGPFGFSNQTSLGAGFSWKSFDADLAAALSAYRFYSCGDTNYCGYVVGAAPGGRGRFAYFPWDNFAGVAATVDVNWYSGRSLVLRPGAAVVLTVGLTFRWQK